MIDMSEQKQAQLVSGEELLKLLKPLKPEEAEVVIKGDIVILRTAGGAQAVLPLREVCRLAERFNLVLKNYNCKK